MKMIGTATVFALTGVLIWTTASYTVQDKDVKPAIREAKKRRLTSQKKHNRTIQAEMEEVSRFLKNTTIETTLDEEFNSLHEKTHKNRSGNSSLPNFGEFPPISQEDSNVVVKDLRQTQGSYLQEKSSLQNIEVYKKNALSRLFSSRPIKKVISENPPTIIEPEKTLDETKQTFIEPSPKNYTKQIPSLTQINKTYEDFNFSKEETLSVSLSTQSTNGKNLPNVRLIIENAAGNILLEGSTDIQGKFQKDITTFTGESLFVRYYGIGISQERRKLNKNGEVE